MLADRSQDQSLAASQTLMKLYGGIMMATPGLNTAMFYLKATHCGIGKSTDSEYLH